MTYRIALIPGDGIGVEVIAEGVRVLEALGRDFGLKLELESFPYSCRRYLAEGAMLPPDGLESLRQFDATFLGAVGWPGVPDHVSLWGLLIPIRRGFDQYVRVCQPAAGAPAARHPLAARRPSARGH